ncbi:MAG: type II secretion system protein, partial [Vulcanimicrobiaceae bacterium]
MAPRPGEQGFTLVEMLVATGVWIVLGGTLLYVTQGLLGDAKLVASQQSSYMQLTRLIETWEAEATSSLAIFVPSTDVLGTDNSDGHELDFYSRDAARAGHF